MITTASICGACAGLGIQVMANALQKLPVTRAPYKHVFCAVVGSFAIDYMVTKTEAMKLVVAAKQLERMEKSHQF